MLTLNNVHSSWLPIVKKALTEVDQHYLLRLMKEQNWLPGIDKIFNAFSLPLSQVKYILFGESPYPRIQSANGFAFWDAAVKELWSEKGLSSGVNRATSLRNFIKLLLIASGKLPINKITQEQISLLNKQDLVLTIDELFSNLLQHGFLLLNATLVWQPKQVSYHAKHWQSFMNRLLAELHTTHPEICLVLLGKFAEKLRILPAVNSFQQVQLEHPYNISFINNLEAINFFRPFNLLLKNQ